MIWLIAVALAQVLEFPMWKNTSEVQKRSISMVAENKKIYYQTTILLGTPPVEVVVDIDTGSSDTWVGSNVFNPSKSSTWRDLHQPFDISYLDGSSARGTYGTDIMQLNGAKVPDTQFAVVSASSTQTFMLGIGLNWAEIPALSNMGATMPYDNVPLMLRKQGLIQSSSYSIWLNDFNDGRNGVLLFGGVDHSHYEGQLTKLPIVSVSEGELGRGYHPSHISRLAVILNGIAITNSRNLRYHIVTNAALPVVLDTGATYNLLPQPWVNAIARSLGAQYDNESRYYLLPHFIEGYATFTFSGVDINVPFEQFLVKAYNADGSPMLKNGQQRWAVGSNGIGGNRLDIEGSDFYLLGDSFLSGVYVAYDLDNLEIGIAAARKNQGSKPQIEAIGSNGLPGTKAPGYATTRGTNNYRVGIARGF